MAPALHEVNEDMDFDAARTSGERVVVSGMSGLYPGARNIKEFADILYGKKNPVSREGCRFKLEHPETPQWAGSVPELDRFDAQFFKVHYRLAVVMDPGARKVLEQVYQAIYDAGVCPEALSDKKVCVFVGVMNSETEKECVYKEKAQTGLGIVGCSKSMFANRISYYLNTRGPSLAVDAGCCSSLVALEMARRCLLSGECDAAVVAGVKLNLHPQTTISYARVTALSPDRNTRSFDENAAGPVFSEAINVLFLQKAKDALRIYADITYVKCEFNEFVESDLGPRFGIIRESEKLSNFMNDFYREANVSPTDVAYVEAYGSAVPDADKAELEAIDKVYCKNRREPLLVGSVMSNIGYTEAASGISSITKVLLGYHTGQLAANLHLDNVRKDIACLSEDRVRLLKEHQPFREGYVAVNGLSITGINGHVLLKGCYKKKEHDRYKTDIPYLLTISGRQESAVKRIINELKTNPIDPEQIALLHNIHLTKTPSHMGKGFTILATGSESQTVCLREQADYYDGAKRPLWFVYSGMGSQWAGMGAHLMRLPIFASAIEKCRQILEPKGLDIIDIITSTDKTIFDNILNSFVGIAAIQIGLTDVLHGLGLTPDNIIGHSVGELGCAYADGCMTAEEMILSAYYRGLVSLQTPLIPGAMAAVGIGYQQVIKLCPADVEVACHNSAESCTISGPVDSIKAFAVKLTSESIFIREVASSNIAYHSRYIADAGPTFMKYLKDVIKTPKPRSERWISTSVPRDKWSNHEAKYSSAEYHTNNLLYPVLFEESLQLIPANAVLVEIAPHGLLQAILKRALPPSCVNMPLTLRGNNNLVFLLEAIGKLYMQGFLPKVSTLYPKVDFPVSTGTPMLSHLVEWAHDEKWLLSKYIAPDSKLTAACKFVISTHDDEHTYLQGHILRGKNLYPFAAVLVDVWDTLAMSMHQSRKTMSVQFSDVRFYSQSTLHERRQLRLNVAIHRVSGRFEVLDDVSKIATGIIFQGNFKNNPLNLALENNNNEDFSVNSDDFYEMAFNRDYYYSGDFRSIHSATSSMTAARVLWRRNWVTFIDAMLQLDALRCAHQTVSQPQFVRNIYINIEKQYDSEMLHLDDEDMMIANVFEETDCVSCGGVVIQNIFYHHLMPLNRDPVSFQALKLVPQLQSQPNQVPTEENYVPLQRRLVSKCNLQLQCAKLGRLDSLQWVEASSFSEEGVDVTVSYAGLTYEDFEGCIGVKPDEEYENTFGAQFSGMLNDGQRVMGMVKGGTARTRVRAPPQLLWPVPPHWSLEDAGTVPHAYCLAYYCLVERFQLLPGMRICVEDGASAFGQAMIAVAVANSCEVFTNVRTASQKGHLLTLFPELKDDHVCCECGNEYTDLILSITKGKGCNFVISRARKGLMKDILKRAAANGVTLLIDCKQEYILDMFFLSKSRNVVFLQLSQIFQKMDIKLFERLQRLVSEGIARGVVRPLLRVAYPPEHVVRAFRCLEHNTHCGCVLLHLNDRLLAKPRLHCSPDKLQFISCSNGALGLLLAEKLVQNGARKLHINSQRVPKYIAYKLRYYHKGDVQVFMSSRHLSDAINVHDVLNSCNNVAPVESVHIVTLEGSGQSGDDAQKAIHNLDLESRKLCPSLKYFTVLNEDNVGQSTCISRKQHDLPATMLKLSDLIKIKDKDAAWGQGFTRWEAVEALEEAVLSQQAVVRASKQVAAPRSVLSEIAELSNISISEDLNPNTTLVELDIYAAKACTVASYLEDMHNVSFSEQEVENLSINKLMEIEEILQNHIFKETKGLESFFTYIEPDELIGNLDMMFLPTLFNESEGEAEIAMKQKHILIVPGVEGSHARFVQLCERLKLPALLLQPGVDRQQETPAQMAQRFVQTVLKNMHLKGEFYLLGYESGVAVALEMVPILEKQGFVGTVFCVGGGPLAISAAVDELVSGFGSEDALQEALVRHMMRLMTGEDHINMRALNAVFRGGVSWKDKVEASVRLLLGSVSHSAQYARQVIESAYARLQRARSCEVTPRAFRSLIVALLPASSSPLSVAELQSFSQQPVKWYQLQAPLGQATNDLRCAAIVNHHFSSEILLEFKLKNKCIILQPNSIIGEAID